MATTPQRLQRPQRPRRPLSPRVRAAALVLGLLAGALAAAPAAADTTAVLSVADDGTRTMMNSQVATVEVYQDECAVCTVDAAAVYGQYNRWRS